MNHKVTRTPFDNVQIERNCADRSRPWHVITLRRFGYQPIPGAPVTLITRDFFTPIRACCRAEIRIRDNGTEIPPEVREKMVNPFFTTNPAGEGTGLCLSLSHDIIVKQHAGAIEAHVANRSELTPGRLFFRPLKILAEAA